MYGSSAAERCPGEDDCQRWQLSEEPKTDACATCHLKETKPVKIVAITSLNQEEIDAHIDQTAALAAQQGAGFPIRSCELSPLEFELLKIWHSTVAVYERAQRAELNLMLAAFLKAMCR